MACRVCDGPKAAEVKALLDAGVSVRSTARQTGFPVMTMSDHRRRCLGGERSAPAPASCPALPSVDVEPGDPIAPILKDLQEKHEKLSEAFASADSASMIGTLAAQVRNNLVAQAQLVGKLQRKRDPLEALTAHPDWIAGITAVAEALDRLPEAREAVRLRLEAVVGPMGFLG